MCAMKRALALLLLLLPALAQVRVAATTPILADLVRAVGGDRVRVATVVPPGADPHTFEPTPALAKALSQTQLLFANGLGLEPFLPRLKALLPKGAKVVLLAEGRKGLICEEETHPGRKRTTPTAPATPTSGWTPPTPWPTPRP
jgi:zinc transport system substrate-binding protein